MSQIKLFSENLLLFLLACIVLSSTASGTASALDYNMIELDSLGGTSSSATGINNAGQVVGYATGSDAQQHPFLWTAANGMQTLPTNAHFVPSAISNKGVVAGYVDTYAAFWSSSLGLNTLGEPGGVATSVNDDGLVAGWSGRCTGSSFEEAYVWSSDRSVTDLGFGSDIPSRVYDINNHGQAVGTAAGEAFVWDADDGVHYLGTLGGDESSACAINDAGMVVGVAGVDCDTRAVFAWTEGSGMSPAFTFNYDEDYTPMAVNSSGLIVGNCASGVFTWSAKDGLAVVGSGEVCGVNDAGQLVGRVRTSTGYLAVLWQPLPEPSSLLALLAGLGGVGGMLWRRRAC